MGSYVWLFAIIKTEPTSNSLTKPKLHDRFKEVINVDFQGLILCDLCDGDQYKTHPLFSVQKDDLQLLVYYDDVELYNPLGSSRTKHKLGKC